MNIPSQKYWHKILILLLVLASISFFFTINLPYNGEEGQYTISSLEMLYHHYYWQPLYFGFFYWRPPLYNWLIIGVTHFTGPAHVLISARIVTAIASIFTGFILLFLCQKLFNNNVFSLLSVAIFFSGDFLFRRAWIAYADPLFAFFIFTSISFLLMSCYKQKPIYWIPIPATLLLGLLTKAVTIYVFYGTAIIVLLCISDYRKYLLKPASIITHFTALLLIILWFTYVPDVTWHNMFYDISHNSVSSFKGISNYFKKIISAPIELILRLAPMSLFALLSPFFKSKSAQAQALPQINSALIKPIFWMVTLGTIPYWFSTSNLPIRYFLPLFPLIAILFAFLIWQKGERAIQLSLIILGIELIIKCITSFVGLPWFEHMDYKIETISKEIVEQSKGFGNLYAHGMDNRAGLSITGNIDAYRWPEAPIVEPPEFFKGCVITREHDSKWGELKTTYNLELQKSIFYLYCR